MNGIAFVHFGIACRGTAACRGLPVLPCPQGRQGGRSLVIADYLA